MGRPLYIALAALFLLAGGFLLVPEERSDPAPDGEVVVLLHGLLRSSRSMGRLERRLNREGYRTCNLDYPSRQYAIGELAEDYVLPGIEKCLGSTSGPVHFVTHSMGGVVVRYLAAKDLLPPVGRVVMLGPPNHGSEVVDKVGDTWLFDWINGPAGRELGTDSTSVPMSVGDPDFELGVIAGTQSLNPVNSVIIEGTDDGKVSIESHASGRDDRPPGAPGHTHVHDAKPSGNRPDGAFSARGCFLPLAAPWFAPSLLCIFEKTGPECLPCRTKPTASIVPSGGPCAS